MTDLVTKEELARHLFNNGGLHIATVSRARLIVDEIFTKVSGEISKGRPVILPKLGRLTVKRRSERKAKLPGETEAMIIPAKNVVKFSTGHELDAAVQSAATPVG